MQPWRKLRYRKGFTRITVDGKLYQYAVSFPMSQMKALLIVYDEQEKRMEFPAKIDESLRYVWRGKNDHGCWSKEQVANAIRNRLLQIEDKFNREMTWEKWNKSK